MYLKPNMLHVLSDGDIIRTTQVELDMVSLLQYKYISYSFDIFSMPISTYDTKLDD